MTGAVIQQPNSAWCFVCGLENPFGLKLVFYETGPDEVRATYTPPEHFQGFPGVLHGGIVASLLDEAGGRVVMIGDHKRFMMTAKLEIRYRQPTPLGQPLTVVGKLLKMRGRLATAHSEIRLADGSVTAEADLTLADLPADYEIGADLEGLGWRVYEDARDGQPGDGGG
ncbi:MAG: PaaI family thioesterase [Anaerolineales bacterium]